MDGSENDISGMIVPVPRLGLPLGRFEWLEGTRTLEAEATRGASPRTGPTVGSPGTVTTYSGARSVRLRVLPAGLLALSAVLREGTSRQQAFQESAWKLYAF